MGRFQVLVGLLVAAVALSGATPMPLIVGHRGASGHRPEHTLEGYSLAIEMGADAVEPDLVSTKDGVLIARHENEIGGTTDVAEKFPSRRTAKQVEGQSVTGWFTEDFTLAEIKSLRARERLSFRSHQYDGQFVVPTFDEIINLAVRKGREVGREIAVYPETKHPTYFRGLGLPLEEPLVAVLTKHGLTEKSSPVFIQSFDASSLQRLRPLIGARRVQLLDEGADIRPGRLDEISRYADGVGPNKRLIVPVGPDGRVLAPTTLVRDAHAARLFVHVWTMRSDAMFLSPTYAGDPKQEIRQFADLGVDGVFTDFPDVAASVLRK